MNRLGVLRPASPPAWLAYAVVGAVLVGVYYALPHAAGVPQALIFLAAPVGAAIVCARAARRCPDPGVNPWALLAGALALASLSDTFYLGAPLVTGHWIAFPSVVDVIWLGSYPFYVLAIWALIRRQRESDRRGNLLDVAIIVANGAIPLWAFVLAPVVDDRGAGLAGQIVSCIYPSLDLVLFATLLRFAVAARTTTPAMRLLVSAIACLLAADVNYVFQLTHGTFGDGGLSDGFWIASGVLVAAAALHPTASRRPVDEPVAAARMSPGRMVFLGIALLVGPLVLSGRPDDTLLLAAFSSLSFMLVMARMSLLTRNLVAAHAVVEQTSDLLRHQALHDALTGLPNRVLLLDRLDRMQARARRSGLACVALQIDLDGFKAVNDALGRDAGDRLLVAVAERLVTALPELDTIARPGGDEFVLLVDDPQLAAAPELVADRVLDVLHRPFTLGNDESTTGVSASIGIAVGPRATPGELLREAAVAVREAKATGRDCHQRFRPEMEAEIQRRYELEVDLRTALDRDEFFLVYQPVFGVDDGSPAGFEALLRWQHPGKGLIGPDEFVPLLEATGLIVQVGRWVLQTACRQTARWWAAGWQVGIAVNVSGRQLDRDRIVDDVADALRDSRLPARALTVEITETALMTDVARTSGRLHDLVALGVRVAVDDFGTGYSSLAYLQQFPVDCLKIDRTFTAKLGESPEADALVHVLVELGKSLGLATLAEGVETEAQLEHLRREGVDYAQGFLLARPLPVEAAERLLLAPAGVTV